MVGQTPDLFWASTYANDVKINNNIGDVSKEGVADGSVSITGNTDMAGETTYTITATGPGGAATDTQQIIVDENPQGPTGAGWVAFVVPILTQVGIAGTPFTLSWQVENFGATQSASVKADPNRGIWLGDCTISDCSSPRRRSNNSSHLRNQRQLKTNDLLFHMST